MTTSQICYYMGKHSFADNILLDVNATGNLESPRSIVGV